MKSLRPHEPLHPLEAFEMARRDQQEYARPPLHKGMIATQEFYLLPLVRASSDQKMSVRRELQSSRRRTLVDRYRLGEFHISRPGDFLAIYAQL
jgi:hypothetical protein